jgi:hypothetical protein
MLIRRKLCPDRPLPPKSPKSVKEVLEEPKFSCLIWMSELTSDVLSLWSHFLPEVHHDCHSGPEEVPYLQEEAYSNPTTLGVAPID